MTQKYNEIKELLIGSDFAIEADPKYQKLIFKILKPVKFADIRIILEKVTPIENDDGTLNLNLDYNYLNLPKNFKKRVLDKDQEFQNVIGSIVFTILLMNIKEYQKSDDTIDEITGQPTRKSISGEFDT